MFILLASLLGIAHATPCGLLVDDLDRAIDGAATPSAHSRTCLTPALHTLTERAYDQGLEACLSQALRQRGLGDLPVRPPPAKPALGSDEKGLRDPYDLEYLHETPNFAIRWGGYTGFGDSHVLALADALEDSWAVLVDDMDHPPPLGSDSHKVNVYIGDSGGGAPPSGGSAGYYHYDPDGWPMIVIAASVTASPDYSHLTASHELYHALQDAAESFAYLGNGAWWWEATATWAESEVYPEDPGAAGMLFAFAFRPELPVSYFNYPQTGALDEYYQYGAFIFARYLSEYHGGWPLIRDSWVDAGWGDDPLEVLDELLREEGTDLDAAFFDFTLRTATWDFERGDWYRAWIAAYGGWNADASKRPQGTLRGSDQGWVRPKEGLPATYGANYWLLEDIPEPADIALQGDAGSFWKGGVVLRAGDEHFLHPMTIDDAGKGDVVLKDVPDHDEAWLAVVAIDGWQDQGDTFGYRVRMREARPSVLEELGCGCSTAARPLPWLPILVAAAAMAWRRRHPSRSQPAASMAW